MYKSLKVKLRVFLAGHIVAMVTYCVTKIIPTCLRVIGQFFDTMIGNYDPSKSTSWKVLETVSSHLNQLSLLLLCATASDVCAKRHSLDSSYLERGIF